MHKPTSLLFNEQSRLSIQLADGQTCWAFLKESRRIRKLKIQIDACRGLEILIPYGTKPQITTILKKHMPWLMRHKAHLLATPNIEQTTNLYPETLDLLTLNETWKIQYTKNPTLGADFKQNILICPHGSRENIHDHLLHWLKTYAHYNFVSLLEKLTICTNLTFSRLTISKALSSWGTCTRSKAISLNYKLLFLPEKITQYVMLHELCHTVYLDHSKNFWQLVKQYEPDYKACRALLRTANQYLPAWIKQYY